MRWTAAVSGEGNLPRYRSIVNRPGGTPFHVKVYHWSSRRFLADSLHLYKVVGPAVLFIGRAILAPRLSPL